LGGSGVTEGDLRFFRKLKDYGKELADFDREPTRNWEAELLAHGAPVQLFGAENPETSQREAYTRLKLAVSKYYNLDLETVTAAEGLRILAEIKQIETKNT